VCVRKLRLEDARPKPKPVALVKRPRRRSCEGSCFQGDECSACYDWYWGKQAKRRRAWERQEKKRKVVKQ
jgi:hypothetical protein